MDWWHLIRWATVTCKADNALRIMPCSSILVSTTFVNSMVRFYYFLVILFGTALIHPSMSIAMYVVTCDFDSFYDQWNQSSYWLLLIFPTKIKYANRICVTHPISSRLKMSYPNWKPRRHVFKLMPTQSTKLLHIHIMTPDSPPCQRLHALHDITAEFACLIDHLTFWSVKTIV